MAIPDVPTRLIRKIIFAVGVPSSFADVRAFRELLFRELQLDGRMEEADRVRVISLTAISVAISEVI